MCRNDKMSRMFLSGLRHISLRWLNLLVRVIGRQRRRFKKGTWMRLTCLGCSQWLVESDKRHTVGIQYRLFMYSTGPDIFHSEVRLGKSEHVEPEQVDYEGEARDYVKTILTQDHCYSTFFST